MMASYVQVVSKIPEDGWVSLHKAWLGWLTTLRESTFAPGTVRSNGSYSVLGGDSPYILSSERDMHIGTRSVLAMLDDYYTGIHEGERFQQLRQQLVGKVGAAVKKAQAKVKLYEDQIKASNGYAAISYTADLLMANLHVSQPGASSVQILKQGSLLQLHWTLCRRHSQLPKSSISAARSSEGLRRQLHPC